MPHTTAPLIHRANKIHTSSLVERRKDDTGKQATRQEITNNTSALLSVEESLPNKIVAKESAETEESPTDPSFDFDRTFTVHKARILIPIPESTRP
eukprot:scaffold34915_cov180-Amphora_coffeaeformis.AAC.13